MAAIVFGIIAGAATLLGMWLVVAREQWARRNSVYLIAFSIGVLLATSITEIIPESLELSPYALYIVLGTFFAFYVLEHSVVAHHHHHHQLVEREHEGEPHVPIEKLAFVGLAVHSLIDGLAIGAGFEVSAALGIIATVAVILHEVPEGIVTLSLFLHADYPKRRAIALTAIVALATPLGAILTTIVPSFLTQEALAASMAWNKLLLVHLNILLLGYLTPPRERRPA